MSVVARLIGARFEPSELVPERGASEIEPFLGGRKIEAREESRLLGSDSGSSVKMASAPSFLEVNHCPIDLEILTDRVSDLSIFPERGKWRLGQRVRWQGVRKILQPMFISAMRNFFHVQRYFPPWTFRMTSLSSSNLTGEGCASDQVVSSQKFEEAHLALAFGPMLCCATLYQYSSGTPRWTHPSLILSNHSSTGGSLWGLP